VVETYDDYYYEEVMVVVGLRELAAELMDPTFLLSKADYFY
jgi:hypothetical protein